MPLLNQRKKEKTANKIGELGAKTLSEALKSNSSLTFLDLNCDENMQLKEDTEKIDLKLNNINSQQHWR